MRILAVNVLAVNILAVNRPLSFYVVSKNGFCTLYSVKKRRIHALRAFPRFRGKEAALGEDLRLAAAQLHALARGRQAPQPTLRGQVWRRLCGSDGLELEGGRVRQL